MNDKLPGWLIGSVFMAACCIGVPLLLAFLSGVGLFAWFADNTFGVIALVLIAGAIALFRKERKKRRHLGTRAQAVERAVTDNALPSTQRWRQRSTDK